MSDPSQLRVADAERRQIVHNGFSPFGPAPDEDALEARLAAARARRLARERRHSSRRDPLR
jgi:hypothetical protein